MPRSKHSVAKSGSQKLLTIEQFNQLQLGWDDNDAIKQNIQSPEEHRRNVARHNESIIVKLCEFGLGREFGFRVTETELSVLTIPNGPISKRSGSVAIANGTLLGTVFSHGRSDSTIVGFADRNIMERYISGKKGEMEDVLRCCPSLVEAMRNQQPSETDVIGYKDIYSIRDQNRAYNLIYPYVNECIDIVVVPCLDFYPIETDDPIKAEEYVREWISKVRDELDRRFNTMLCIPAFQNRSGTVVIGNLWELDDTVSVTMKNVFVKIMMNELIVAIKRFRYLYNKILIAIPDNRSVAHSQCLNELIFQGILH